MVFSINKIWKNLNLMVAILVFQNCLLAEKTIFVSVYESFKLDTKIEINCYTDYFNWNAPQVRYIKLDSLRRFEFEVPDNIKKLSIYLGSYQPYLLYLDNEQVYHVDFTKINYMPVMLNVVEPKACLHNNIAESESLIAKELRSRMLYSKAMVVPERSKRKQKKAIEKFSEIEKKAFGLSEELEYKKYWSYRKNAFQLEYANQFTYLNDTAIMCAKVFENPWALANLYFECRTDFMVNHANKNQPFNFNQSYSKNDTINQFYKLVVLKYLGEYKGIFPKMVVESSNKYLDNFSVEIIDYDPIRDLYKQLRLRYWETPSKLTMASVNLSDFIGNVGNISQYRGKYVLLDFWAMWCAPCRREMELMPEIADRFQDKLQIVGINIDGDISKAKSYVAKKGYDWTFLTDPFNNKTKAQFNVQFYPTYVLINPKGEILNTPPPLPSKNFVTYFENLLNQ